MLALARVVVSFVDGISLHGSSLVTLILWSFLLLFLFLFDFPQFIYLFIHLLLLVGKVAAWMIFVLDTSAKRHRARLLITKCIRTTIQSTRSFLRNLFFEPKRSVSPLKRRLIKATTRSIADHGRCAPFSAWPRFTTFCCASGLYRDYKIREDKRSQLALTISNTFQ